jgi:hypothetical protein
MAVQTSPPPAVVSMQAPPVSEETIDCVARNVIFKVHGTR